MIDTGFDVILAAMILGVAAGAVLTRAMFAAVVMFIVYGLLVALAWLRLGAVDVGLAEAAIGAGLTGVLLLGALGRVTRQLGEDATPPDAPPQRPVAIRPVALLAALAIAVALGWGFLTLPPPGGLHMPVARNLDATQLGNPVTAVLLNFRAWDTLLETIVLLAALVGVWSLAPDAAWGGRPGLAQRTRPGGVLASFGRLLPPVGLLVGVWLVWAGADRPGGAFQGATVLAAVWLLAAMAGLSDAPRVASLWLRAVLIAGPAVFLALALAGVSAAGFLIVPPGAAKLVTVTVEALLTLSLTAMLGLLVLGPPERPA